MTLHLNNFSGYRGINTWNRTGKITDIHHKPRSYTLLNDKKNIIRYNRRHDIKSLEMEQEIVDEKPAKLTRGNLKSIIVSRNNETTPPHDVEPTQTNYSPYATRSGRRAQITTIWLIKNENRKNKNIVCKREILHLRLRPPSICSLCISIPHSNSVISLVHLRTSGILIACENFNIVLSFVDLIPTSSG